MEALTMKKIFANRNHFFYFTLLILAVSWLATLHWVTNPYKLTVWVYASVFGSIAVESQCEGQRGKSNCNSDRLIHNQSRKGLAFPPGQF